MKQFTTYKFIHIFQLLTGRFRCVQNALFEIIATLHKPKNLMKSQGLFYFTHRKISISWVRDFGDHDFDAVFESLFFDFLLCILTI